MSMEEVRWKAVFPGIEVTSSILQCKFPPFSAKSVHPSVNLPISSTNGKSSGHADEARTALRSLDTFLNQKLLKKCLFKITARLLIEVPNERSSLACFGCSWPF